MSRNFLPAVMAIGMGVFTGMYPISLRQRMVSEPETDWHCYQDTTPSNQHCKIDYPKQTNPRGML